MIFSDYFGTHGFAAPEVLTKALYSCMVDIFSMGKILLYLLFPKKTQQEKAFVEKKFKDGPTAAGRKDYALWPLELEDILRETLSCDQSKRSRLIMHCGTTVM